MPDRCPSCGTELVENGAHMYCPNRDCPEQVKGAISFFASRNQMDIETLGPKFVELLYDQKAVMKVEDIYTADYDALIGLPGVGVKTVDAIKKSVEESKKQPFRIVLSSLGIPEIGKKSAEILINGGFNTIEKLMEAKKEDLVLVPGIGERTADIIIEAMKDEVLLATIESLKKSGLSFSKEEEEKSNELPQSMTGTVWCVTGSFENFNPRGKALEEIERRGGRTVSSVTGRTTHLLAGAGGGSKRKTAEKLGVRIVDEAEFLAMLGGSGQAEEKEKEEETKTAEPQGQLELF